MFRHIETSGTISNTNAHTVDSERSIFPHIETWMRTISPTLKHTRLITKVRYLDVWKLLMRYPTLSNTHCLDVWKLPIRIQHFLTHTVDYESSIFGHIWKRPIRKSNTFNTPLINSSIFRHIETFDTTSKCNTLLVKFRYFHIYRISRYDIQHYNCSSTTHRW